MADGSESIGEVMRAAVNPAELESLIVRLENRLVSIVDNSGEFLQPLGDGRVIDTKSWHGWDWTHGVALYGLWKHHELTGSQDALDKINEWFAFHFERGTPSKNINSMAPMLSLAFVREKFGNLNLDPHLESWAEYLMKGLPRTEENGFQHIVFRNINYQQLWDDTLFMSVLPLAKIGLLFGREEYVNEALRQFLLHIKYLADRKTGLWFHGWTFDGYHHFAEALWARGNSWVTIAIPEIIEMLDLPAGDPIRMFLQETLVKQVDALARLQHSSGMWHTLMDDPSSYLEASATAGFGAGILKGVRKGYLPDNYAEVGRRALLATIRNISPEGELLQTSFGTGMGDTLQFYRDIPLTAMPYGQSLAILCLVEALRQTY